MVISQRLIEFLNFKEISLVDLLHDLPFYNMRASQLNSFVPSKSISLHFFLNISIKNVTWGKRKITTTSREKFIL